MRYYAGCLALGYATGAAGLYGRGAGAEGKRHHRPGPTIALKARHGTITDGNSKERRTAAVYATRST